MAATHRVRHPFVMSNTHPPISAEQWNEILYYLALAVTKNQPKFVKAFLRIREHVKVAKQDDPYAIAQSILDAQTDLGGRSAIR